LILLIILLSVIDQLIDSMLFYWLLIKETVVGWLAFFTSLFLVQNKE